MHSLARRLELDSVVKAADVHSLARRLELDSVVKAADVHSLVDLNSIVWSAQCSMLPISLKIMLACGCVT